MTERELDYKAVHAKEDEQVLADLLRELEPFLLSTASKFTHTYVTRQDDAWSVTLGAFQEAITSYSLEKGSFLSFVRLLIQRRLIDALRSASREPATIPLDHETGSLGSGSTGSGNFEGLRSESPLLAELSRQAFQDDQSASQLREEILDVTRQLDCYGIRFSDLVSQSPKAQKTRDACIQAVRFLCSQPLLLLEMRHSRTLPIKSIEKNTGLPRKILERHRKYIIAVVEILTGEYPGLATYLQPYRKEKD